VGAYHNASQSAWTTAVPKPIGSVSLATTYTFADLLCTKQSVRAPLTWRQLF
jgi:hypothetical protein